MALRHEHFRIMEVLHVHGPATIPALAHFLAIEERIVRQYVQQLREKGYLVGDTTRGNLKIFTFYWYRVERNLVDAEALSRHMEHTQRYARLKRWRRTIIHARSSVAA